jgi:hypothetical protein
MKQQVVSRKRVIDYGEVYTSQREVDAMLDLMKSETERIDSRFLEPACGTGNFLTEILNRKLQVVERRYRKSVFEYERYAVLAISSIYGIDILEDNVLACRDRLACMVEARCASLFRDEFMPAVRYILQRNIIWGDALSLQTVSDPPQPIVFSEWSMVNGCMIKRRDFTFHELLSYAGTKERPLFSDLGDEVFFPEPEKEFPLIHYLRVADADAE